jgi:hypothetical protein
MQVRYVSPWPGVQSLLNGAGVNRLAFNRLAHCAAGSCGEPGVSVVPCYMASPLPLLENGNLLACHLAGDDWIGTVWDRRYGVNQPAHFLGLLEPDASVSA